jgi:ketosteroid isomerase-like protein
MSDDELRLADRIALHELRARYTLHYDAAELDAFVALFADDGMLQLGPVGFARGHDQLRTALAGPMADADFACHFTTDEITEFTGPDTARGVCRFAVHTGRSPNIQGAGTYRDEYRRTPDGWRFVSRLISFFYMGERATDWPTTPPPITPPPMTPAEGS